MTEPQAGSDPQEFTCTAVLDGDEWVINGEKWFASNAKYAEFIILMVVTEPDNPAYQRQSMLIVPTDTPGVEIVRGVGHGGRRHPRRGHPRLHALRRRPGARRTTSSADEATPSWCPRPAWVAGASTTPCAPSAWPAGRSR